MNDFTRNELASIFDAFYYIENDPDWRNTEGWDDELKSKIHSMIDNYCEHKPSIQCSECGSFICKNCEAMYQDDNQ